MRKYPISVTMGATEDAQDYAGIAADKTVWTNGDSVLVGFKFLEALTTGAPTAFDLSAATSLRCTLRAGRTASSTLYVQQTSYNGGYWVANENLASGLVTFVLNLSATDLDDDFDGDADNEITAWLEVTAVFSGLPQTLYQEQVKIRNQVDDGAAGSPPPASPTYYTAAEVDNLLDGRSFHQACRTASTANIADLSTGLANGDTLDGVTLATNDRILLKDQSTGTENGIYVVQSSGTPSRASDFAVFDTVFGAAVRVVKGTVNAGTLWLCTNADGSDTVGTDAITFADAYASLIHADGSVAFTADQSMGSNKITNLANGTADNDAVNKSQLDNAIAGTDFKDNVRAATTANVTLASDVEDGDTLDGVVLATGDRILVKDQSVGTNNGIYVVQASGAPARADDLAAGADAAGILVGVQEGTVNAERMFQCTDDAGSAVVGTDVLTFQTFFGGSAVTSVFGRTGAVTAAASDYDASQVDNDSGVSGAQVSDALNTLDSGKQAADADLAALAALSGTGLVARTAANTYAERTVGSGGTLSVTNGNGVSGNPSLDIDLTNANTWTGLQTLTRLAMATATEKTVSGGTLTVDQGSHKIQPQTGTEDDIDTISGLDDGEICFLVPSDAGTDTLTFKHGAGNLSIVGADDLAVTEGGVLAKRVGATVFIIGGGGGGGLPAGYKYGMSISNNGTDADHDIDITTGKVRDEADAVDIELTAALTKQIDATWASGDAAGGLSSSLSAPANNTWYHVFAIVVGGVADIGFDTSISAANLVADHSATAYRRIGSVRTDGSANILAFTEANGRFLWSDPPQDTAANNPGTSAVTEALDYVPPDVAVDALLNITLDPGSSASSVYISSFSQNDEAPSLASAPGATLYANTGSTEMAEQIDVLTDTSAQIRYRLSSSDANTDLYINTLGWIDPAAIQGGTGPAGPVADRWTTIAGAKYTATPSSTSTIAMSDTSDVVVGMPIRYEDSGGPWYAMITAVTTNTSITIAGAPLDTGDDITTLEVGTADMIMQLSLDPPEKTYGDGAADIGHGETWRLPTAYLVTFSAWHEVDDTGASQPKVNVHVGGSAVSTNDTNLGIQVAAAETETLNSAVAINTTNYEISYGDVVVGRCTAAGTNGDAEYLHLDAYIIVP